MASVVDLCNLALARLGDNATIASIDPPEGSAQAEHCARFYPIARDSLLELHDWNFATKRIAPAQVTYEFNQWQYAYAAPADLIKVVSVLDPESTNDNATNLIVQDTVFGSVNTGLGLYNPKEFSLEIDSSGNKIICTNQENALIRYTALITDSSKFSPLFTEALSWLLASYIAGPLLKGDVGMNASKAAFQMFNVIFTKAVTSDANQRRTTFNPSVSWMVNR